MHASLNHRPSVFTPVQAQQPNRTETYTFGNSMIPTGNYASIKLIFNTMISEVLLDQ
jgi:hypothetical protein